MSAIYQQTTTSFSEPDWKEKADELIQPQSSNVLVMVQNSRLNLEEKLNYSRKCVYQ